MYAQKLLKRNGTVLFLLAVLALLPGCRSAPESAEPDAPDAPSAPATRPARPAPQVDLTVHMEIRDGAPLTLGSDGALLARQAISGIRGTRLAPTDVLVIFRSERLSQTVQPGTPVEWITNLPPGLSARVREAKQGSGTITLLVEGTPAVTLNAPLRMLIPGTILSAKQPCNFTSDEVKFEILEGSVSLTSHTAREEAAPAYAYIAGSIGSPLTAVDLRISLVAAALKETVEAPVPVDWIVNLPAGLSASLQPAEAGSTTLVLAIEGTPDKAANEAVRIVIPPEVLGDVNSFTVPNETVFFRIRGASASAVLVDGTVNLAIIPRDITVNLSGTAFAADLAPGTAVSWITNLPQGLNARVKRVRAGESSAVLTISGTPQAESNDFLTLTVPAQAVSGNTAVSALPNGDARYSISGNLRQISTIDIAGSSSHPNWVGTPQGPLNTPRLPAIKDFEGIGIVRVTATATERLGADSQYHWTGSTVNYGMLIQEAQRAGAHAIINIVIDYVDSIENIETVRQIDSEHEWTEGERSLIAQGILRETSANGVRFAVETSRVTTRTYTGSALAIKYLSGLNFYEAEQLRSQAPAPSGR